MARLTLLSDIDCKIYIDTEFHGIAKANTKYIIEISNGAYWIDCRSVEDTYISYDFDLIANEHSANILKEIKLLHSLRLKQLKAKYDSVGDFIYGYARVENKGKLIGYIDTTYQFKYDDVAVLYDGILSVKRDNHYGVINNSKEIIPIKYDSISLLGDKMLRLGLNGRFCLANIEGVKLTPLKYHKIEYAMNGIYAIYFDKWVFVDSNIIEVDIPNNIILYSTNNDTPIDIERYDITYNSAFGQVPVAYNYHNGDGLLVFENNITFIGEETFEHCYNLISATIPNSVISIGDSAFYDCDSLANITIPDSVTSIGEDAFSGCSSLTSIIIPDSVISIGDNAFIGCESLTAFCGKFASDDNRCLIVNGVLNSFAPAGLTQYVIPDIVITIGQSAFRNCSNLTSTIIPNSVTSIGDFAFSHCSNLTCIIIPDSVTSIGVFAFYNCSNLTSITIPNSVTSIGDGAFSHCSNLTSITIPDSVTSIGEDAFYGCSRLTDITIPNSVTSIGRFAFALCESLPIINNIRYADCYAVYVSDRTLTTYAFKKGVRFIGSAAFNYCHSLVEISIPNSVTSIGDSAFSHCSNLTSITIPDSVTSIGDYAFYDCINLKTVYCKPTTPPTVGKGIFTNNASDQKIYVPTSSVDAYKTAEYWSEYADKIVGYDF